MIYGSVCSGIEAASVAWSGLGWSPAFFSEIEKFPRAVLRQRYPRVPLHGDFTTIERYHYGSIDVLVGGTPCQTFSVAGKRSGLGDARGGLALEYVDLAHRLGAKWLLWENVPGVLSSRGGRDFGAFLGALGKCGYGWAYRVLDAQYFGVPQRRRRVFCVGYTGDWRPAAAVLFERESLRGDSTKSREKRQKLTGPVESSAGECGRPEAYGGNNCAGPIKIATAVNASPSRRYDFESETFIVHGTQYPGVSTDKCYTMGCNRGQENVVTQRSTVRKLTPRECERLQGFPDDWTRVPWRGKSADGCPDGPRYTAIGNSMAVPVMRWLGERIGLVERTLGEMRESGHTN